VGTYQSGAALAFSGGERVARTKADPLNILEWFDVTQFVPNEPFTLRRLSSRVADLRSAGTRKWDITIQKSIRIRERRSLNVQAEMYNAFNTTHFASPNTNVTSTSFGRITGVALGPRQIQLAARVSF
jgi:hypothetical protein